MLYNFTDEMIPGGTSNPPLRRVVDAPFTSKSHFGLLAVRCLSYMGYSYWKIRRHHLVMNSRLRSLETVIVVE